MDFQHYVQFLDQADDVIVTRRVYIKIAQDYMAGVLLGQIIYWYRPGKTGASKLRIERDGHLWIVKGYEDWEAEIGMSPKQARRALDVLIERKLVETAQYRFQGLKKTHLRLIGDRFMTAILTELKAPVCPIGQMGLPSGADGSALQGIPSIAENTNKDYSKEGASPLGTVLPEKKVRTGTPEPNLSSGTTVRTDDAEMETIESLRAWGSELERGVRLNPVDRTRRIEFYNGLDREALREQVAALDQKLAESDPLFADFLTLGRIIRKTYPVYAKRNRRRLGDYDENARKALSELREQEFALAPYVEATLPAMLAKAIPFTWNTFAGAHFISNYGMKHAPVDAPAESIANYREQFLARKQQEQSKKG